MHFNHSAIHRCVKAITSGEVVAYPTEAVWGLGCDPFHRHAVEKILLLKARPWHKGLILIAGELAQVEFLLHGLIDRERDTLLDSWPGHNTWLIPHHGRIPRWVCGDSSCVAVRVSNHPFVRQLCAAVGGPIISTSANPAGLPAATTGLKARCYFRGANLVYAPGQVMAPGSASMIRDLASGRVIRG